MKNVRKTGWVAAAMAFAVAGSQVPRWLHAGDRAPVVVVPTTNPAALGWPLKNPDATYAIASDMCSALPASSLARQAMSNDPEQAKSAIDQLRDEGPAGLDALLEANKSEVAAHRGGGFSVFFGKPDDNWPKIRSAIDAVAAQRDAYASGLYWYTDFAKAQAASRASGKPILSLRLLGNLNDEYSCANSRFFRTVLYANTEVSKELREKFILHWQSVRPVPVITIDFGDGRKIRRTITGNSIHYVLTAEGKVVDGIPGLYGSKAFLRELHESEKEFSNLPDDGSSSGSLMQWHRDQEARILADFQSDAGVLSSVAPPSLDTKVKPLVLGNGESGPATYAPAGFVAGGKDGVSAPLSDLISASAPGVGFSSTFLPNPLATPTAAQAAPLAYTKSGVERPLVASLAPRHEQDVREQLAQSDLSASRSPQSLTDSEWSRIAVMHAEDAGLDQGSQALMAAKSPDAATAGRRAMSKMYVETPLIRAMRNFQRSIAEDTVRNEYLFHMQIHRWLADPASANLVDDVAALNKKVYAELFLTPDSDPWLGLVPADTYSALDDDGVCH